MLYLPADCQLVSFMPHPEDERLFAALQSRTEKSRYVWVGVAVSSLPLLEPFIMPSKAPCHVVSLMFSFAKDTMGQSISVSPMPKQIWGGCCQSPLSIGTPNLH